MTPALTFALWGAFLATLLAIGAIAFGLPDPETPALLGGGAVLMWVLAGFIALRRLGVPRLGSPAASPSLSPPTVWLAVSLTLLAVSAELGFWLALIAGGMTLVGIGGLVREWLAQREAVRQAERAAGSARARVVEE